MQPFTENIQTFALRGNMFAHTATFLGGATSLSVNTSDIDTMTGLDIFERIWDSQTNEFIGRYVVQIELPLDEDKYCFNVTALQSSSDEQVVEPKTAMIGLCYYVPIQRIN